MKIGTYIQTTEQRDALTTEQILLARMELLTKSTASSQAALKLKYMSRFPSPKV